MTFRAAFDCLWCGRPHAVRSRGDLEGWAQLCPDCLGRAGDNGFLRARLRAALDERARSATDESARSAPDESARSAPDERARSTSSERPAPESRNVVVLGDRPAFAPDEPTSAPASIPVSAPVAAAAPVAPVAAAAPVAPLAAAAPDLDNEMRRYYAARAGEYDDWYLRRGRYTRGPLHDLAWQADLETAADWLDSQETGAEIVELAAGTGWWSPILARKGELWLYDAVAEPLERARERLVAHRLRAHLHLGDAWAEPDRQVDTLFTGFWLSHVPRVRLVEFLGVTRRWLRPGGHFLFIDSRRDPQSGAVDQPASSEPDVSRRRLADGREFRIPKVHYEVDELVEALLAAGYATAEVTTTARFFLLGRAVA